MAAATEFSATQRLAQFATDLRSDELPDAVRAQVRITLIDFFRAAIAGVHMPWTVRVSQALQELGGRPVAALLFSDVRTDPVRAAYINGVIAGSLEWDDTHVGAMLHPGVVVWPAALAAAQLSCAGGRDIVAAVVAGYETMIRVGLSVQPSHFRRGFQSTATCGVFGAAVAAARVLGLGVEATRDALGLAASYAGGTTQFFLSGSDVKRVHAGKASAAGVEAALLARAGLSGPRDGIEGAQGFAHSHADAFDPAVIEEGLGTQYRMLDLTFKPHAGSARLQAAVEAACELVREGVAPGVVARVEIGIPAVIEGRLTLNEPMGGQQAQMSVPFAVAMALTLAAQRPAPLTLTVEDFAHCAQDKAIRALARRVHCVQDAEIESLTTTDHVPARVTVELRSGGRREKLISVPQGSPRRPMSFDEINARFQALAAAKLETASLQAWLTAARDPEQAAHADEFMTLRLAR